MQAKRKLVLFSMTGALRPTTKAMLFVAPIHLPIHNLQVCLIAALIDRAPFSHPTDCRAGRVARAARIRHRLKMLRCADAKKSIEGNYTRYTSAATASQDIAKYLPRRLRTRLKYSRKHVLGSDANSASSPSCTQIQQVHLPLARLLRVAMPNFCCHILCLS
jgi:hypothetical protein